MPLKQKQFVPFMIVVAVITIIVIIFSSFNFIEKRQNRFKESISESDSLLAMNVPIVGTNDSLTINTYKGKDVLLVFWATWSEKSEKMLEEIQRYKKEADSLVVIAALVKDAEESLPPEKIYPEFKYVDGIKMFNDLKVPGIPTYILFDESAKVLQTQVGYQESVGYDSLKSYLK